MESASTATRPGLLAVAALYVAVALWFLWPLPLHGATHVSYPAGGMAEIGADLRLITWALAWDTHALLTDPAHLFDANIFHPAPSALAFSEHFLGYLPLFAPTYLATGNPILASNVLLFLTYPLCALAAYALAHRFVSAPAAFVAGAAYAFCGLRYDTLYHLHQLGTFWLPLALLLTERWLAAARRRDALLLAATLALQLLSSFYLAYALLVLYGAYLMLAAWRWRGTIDRRRLVGLGAAVAVGALPFVLASLPYLRLQQLGVIPSGDEVATGSRLTLDPRVTRLQIDRYLTGGSVGVLGWVLVAIALLPVWRARTDRPDATGATHDATAAPPWRVRAYPALLGLALVVTGILFAAGPRLALAGVELPSPYALLQRVVPGFSTVRLPARFLVVTQLGLALLVGLGIDRLLLQRLHGRRAWLAGIATAGAMLLVAGPWAPHPLQEEWPPATRAELLRTLREQGDGGTVIELPIGDVTTSSRRMLASTAHWLPTIDGYSAYPPPTRNLLRRIASALPEPTALQELVELAGARWLVVHLADLSPDERRRWQSPPPGLEEIGTWGEDRLYRITREPERDLRARIRSQSETLGGARLAPLGEACPGRLGAVIITSEKALQPGTRYDVATLIENLGSDVWPGFSMFPRHVVTMRLTVRREAADQPALSVATFPLWHDVPPGPGVHLGVEVTTPKAPGDYVLEVSLVQEGETLDRCGTASLRLPLRVRATRRP